MRLLANRDSVQVAHECRRECHLTHAGNLSCTWGPRHVALTRRTDIRPVPGLDPLAAAQKVKTLIVEARKPRERDTGTHNLALQSVRRYLEHVIHIVQVLNRRAQVLTGLQLNASQARPVGQQAKTYLPLSRVLRPAVRNQPVLVQVFPDGEGTCGKVGVARVAGQRGSEACTEHLTQRRTPLRHRDGKVAAHRLPQTCLPVQDCSKAPESTHEANRLSGSELQASASKAGQH